MMGDLVPNKLADHNSMLDPETYGNTLNQHTELKRKHTEQYIKILHKSKD